MSLSIESMKFVIFGSGHDYTLLDSGDGELQIFSHPFVPLGSVNYAGQYYFVVVDEYGDPIDAVKDDLAHITFDPPLGTTFDTEGEVTVKAHYYHEYIHDEETIVVEKEVEQTITVVNHGNVARSATTSFGVYYCSDIYDDGYAFLHPKNVNDLEDVEHCQPLAGNIKRVSSIFWRTESIGHYNGFLSTNILDYDGLDELRFADVSRVTKIRGLVCWDYSTDFDLSPVEGWDTRNVKDLSELLLEDYALTSLKGLEGWKLPKLENLDRAFLTNKSLTDISALSDWSVGELKSAERMLEGCSSLTSLLALSKWRPAKLKSFKKGLEGTTALKNLAGLEDWVVSSLTDITQFLYRSGVETLSALSNWRPHLTDMTEAFYDTQLRNFVGIEGFDTSGVKDLTQSFAGNSKLLSCDGLENMDVSNVEIFYEAFFGDAWLEDITALSGWNTSSMTNGEKTFGNMASILSTSPLDGWDFSGASLGGFMMAFKKFHSGAINKDVWANGVGYYFDYEGNSYGYGGLIPITEYVKDASSAEGWNVTGTGLGAFNSPEWSNVPSWN